MADIILAGVDDKVLITVCCGAVIFLIAVFLTFSKLQNSSGPASSFAASASNHQSFNNDICPICLGVQRLAVETNCGHKFCGTCLRSYSNRSAGNYVLFSNPMSCPLCRQFINILLPNFSTEDLLSVDLEEEKRAVERFIHAYNATFGHGPRNLLSYIRDCPVLIRHMFFDFFSFGGLVWMFRLRVVLCCLGAVVYLFSPLDIIPEAMFGVFGFLDDVIIFLFCVIYVSVIYRRVIIRRATASV